MIYYYHNETISIFLFTAYGKHMKANLSKVERNALQMLIKQVVTIYED